MAAIILQPLPTNTNSTSSLYSLPQSILSSKSPTIWLSPPHKPKPKALLQTPQISGSKPQPISTLSPQNPNTNTNTTNNNSNCSSSNYDYPTTDDYVNLLHIAVRYSDIELAMAVHASILKLEQEDTLLWNTLLAAYLKLGFTNFAQKVFDNISCPDVVSYTTLISGFAKSDREHEAMELFVGMTSSGLEPNEYSFVAILSACIRLSSLKLGSQAHALIIKMDYLDCIYVCNVLMGLYGKCGCLDVVLNLFDEMPQRDIATWNTVNP